MVGQPSGRQRLCSGGSSSSSSNREEEAPADPGLIARRSMDLRMGLELTAIDPSLPLARCFHISALLRYGRPQQFPVWHFESA